MLPRTARLPCWRTTTPFIRPACVVPRSTPWKPSSYGSQFRAFKSSQGPLRRQATEDKAAEQKTATASASAADQKSSQNVAATKKNDFMSEAALGNKEQRKADWAIMKEMAKYLWPKVRTRLSGGRAWTERLTGYFYVGRLGY